MMLSENAVVRDAEAGRAEAFSCSHRRTLLEIAILVVSGVIFSCAFPAINFGGLAWVALIPLFFVCRDVSVKKAFAYGFIWGYVLNLIIFYWLREIQFMIPFAMAAVLACFSAMWAAAVPFFWKNLLYPTEVRLDGSESVKAFYRFSPVMETLCTFGLAAWWCCTEWIRTWIFTGLPWNLLSVTQWQNISVIQICEYTGIYGVSFMIVSINIALFFAAAGLKRSLAEGKYKRPFPLIIAVVIVMVCSVAGIKMLSMRSSQFKNTYDVPIGVVQCNLTQRRHPQKGQGDEAIEVCSSLTRELIEKSSAERKIALEALMASPANMSRATGDDAFINRKKISDLALVVWPETAVPYALNSNTPESRKYREEVNSLLKKYKVPMLIGSINVEFKPDSDRKVDIYNSAFLLTPEKGVADIYSKVHIVPFGEYIPFGDAIPMLNKMVGMGRNLSVGKRFNPIEIAPNVRAGISICYEDIFPYVSREHVRNGANMLLVITNDAWYPTSFEPDQHFANSIFRCIETRLPMLRSGNANYSGVILPDGRLSDSIFRRTDPATRKEMLQPELKQRGAEKLMIPVPKKYEPTFYVKYGDVFILACWLLAGSALITAFSRLRLYKEGLSLAEERDKIKAQFIGK